MKLPDELSSSILSYCRAQISEQRLQRMAVARRVGRLRGFLKGESTDWFDTTTWRYRAFEDSPDYDADNIPRYRYHINITGAAWQVLQAAIQTAGIPGSTFEPQNSKDIADIDTAHIAKSISDYQHKVIDFRALWMGVFRYFYTDGLCLCYEHHIRDSTRYGFSSTTKESRIEVATPPGYACPTCQSFYTADQIGANDGGQPFCPDCGQAYGEGSYQGPGTRIEAVAEQVDIPAGREIVDLFGALETVLPWWAPTQDKCPYQAIRIEVPPEMILQTWPDLEGQVYTTDDGTEDYRFKIARQQAKTPKDSPFYPLYRFPTYGRWWLRPECFYREKDKGIRDELLQEFPDGMFFQEVNMEHVDAIPEKMDEHLELMKAFESDGMYCPSIGENGVPIQESVNTAWNQQLEADEFAAFPPVLIDSELLNGVAFKETKARPGQYKEITLPPGKTLRDSVFQVVIKENTIAGNRILDSYQQFMDYLVGISQALLGGSIVNTRSAEQYNTQRSQSLERQAPPYEAAKKGMARVDEMLVNDFLRYRTNEEFMAVVGESAVSQQEELSRLATNRGKIFAQAEESESIPQTWAQKQSAIDNMLESQNPAIQSWVSDPNNLREIAKAKALPEWTIPGLEQQEKAERTIQILLQEPPMPGDPQPDPVTGQLVPGQPKPSIEFDPLFDDPAIVLAVIKNWAASEAGIQAVKTNPNFLNLRLYAQQAADVLNPPKPQLTPQQLEQDAANAIDSAVNDSQDPYKAGNIGAQVIKLLNPPKPGSVQ